ncbi:MAG: hypothetical protein GYA24_25985, partial [Candidatus Lokiarchaeota archaeon]|nr:hypothetical protein [Candidatus Lokiarchaeota archaeon]
MDRIVIPCSKCGRPLAALPTMARRKCAACGATTKIAPAQRAQAIPIKDLGEKLAASAKQPQLD